MEVEFCDKKIIMSANTDARIGSFALDLSPLKFEACRERFACKFLESTKGFYFKHAEGNGENIASFILKTEKIVRARKHSKFSLTNHDSILWYEPARFWRCCRCRRSLLTIFLRAGMMYKMDSDNYEEALFGQAYVKPTKKAVMRFLFGFTKYVGPELGGSANLETKGWKTIFSNRSDLEVKSYLVSPRSESRPELKEHIWA